MQRGKGISNVNTVYVRYLRAIVTVRIWAACVLMRGKGCYCSVCRVSEGECAGQGLVRAWADGSEDGCAGNGVDVRASVRVNVGMRAGINV